jgi:hypothetical protein
MAYYDRREQRQLSMEGGESVEECEQWSIGQLWL